MGQNKEQLNKLLAFIDELAKDKDNAWFVDELGKRLGPKSCSFEMADNSENRINEIYEYCIEKVIREQAEQFYKDFPIKELVPVLAIDFCRMERYKREDNFEGFCLSAFQQVENVVNWFCRRPRFIEHYNNKFDSRPEKYKTEKVETIGQIFFGIEDWKTYKGKALSQLYFNQRLKAVLYFVYFQGEPYKHPFDEKYNELNELYQCRNLNHRGGDFSPYQENIISSIIPQKYLYYLKFTGLLADFMAHISRFMSKRECEGYIVSILPKMLYVKTDNGDTLVIDKGKLLNRVNLFEPGNRVHVEKNLFTGALVDIKKTENKISTD